MIFAIGGGLLVSYGLIYSGLSTIQLGAAGAVSTLQALTPKGKVLPGSLPKPKPTAPSGARVGGTSSPAGGRK